MKSAKFSVYFILFSSLFFSQTIIAKESHQRKLKRLGIRSYNVPIHDQSAEWLRKAFEDKYAKSRGNPVNISLLMRNIIWQQRAARLKSTTKDVSLFLTGRQKRPFRGNIRSFWYAYTKAPLDNLNIVKKSHYKILSNTFTKLVDEGLIQYQDIGFTDETKPTRILGKTDNVIVVAEKLGHLELLQELNKKYGVTVIMLGGQSSLLKASFFTNDIKKSGTNLKRKFHLFTIVDYDTSGWIVRDGFIKHLAIYKIKDITVTNLIRPDLLDEASIRVRTVKLPNPPNMEKKNKNWLKESGGINGELLGLQVEAFNPDDIEKEFFRLVTPILEENLRREKKAA